MIVPRLPTPAEDVGQCGCGFFNLASLYPRSGVPPEPLRELLREDYFSELSARKLRNKLTWVSVRYSDFGRSPP